MNEEMAIPSQRKSFHSTYIVSQELVPNTPSRQAYAHDRVVHGVFYRSAMSKLSSVTPSTCKHAARENSTIARTPSIRHLHRQDPALLGIRGTFLHVPHSTLAF